jgi:hypothetical protein
MLKKRKKRIDNYPITRVRLNKKEERRNQIKIKTIKKKRKKAKLKRMKNLKR